jgi:general secretion pathway protein K
MKKTDERGVALLMVLLILSLLVPLILEFDSEARRELREAAAFRDNFKAAMLVRSSVEVCQAILRYDTELDRQTGRVYDGLTDAWAIPISNYPLGDGILAARIEDEHGKFDLNSLTTQSDSPAELAKVARLKRLFHLLRLDPRLVEALTDWVDPDDQAEPNGAENAYYLAQTTPYRAANGPMQTLDELHLVKGFTDEVVRQITPYVTVHTLGGLVNVNTADPLVLQALDPRITPEIAQELIQARPFLTIQDLDRVKSIESIAKELRTMSVYTVRSDDFSTRVTATINEVTKTARAVIRRTSENGDSDVTYFRLE